MTTITLACTILIVSEGNTVNTVTITVEEARSFQVQEFGSQNKNSIPAKEPAVVVVIPINNIGCCGPTHSYLPR